MCTRVTSKDCDQAWCESAVKLTVEVTSHTGNLGSEPESRTHVGILAVGGEAAATRCESGPGGDARGLENPAALCTRAGWCGLIDYQHGPSVREDAMQTLSPRPPLGVSVDDAGDSSSYWVQLPERVPFSTPPAGTSARTRGVHTGAHNRSLSPTRLLFVEGELFGEPAGGGRAGRRTGAAVQTPQRHTVASRLRHAMTDEHIFRGRYKNVLERYALLQDDFREQELRVLSLEHRSAGLHEKLRCAEAQQHRLQSQLQQAQDAVQAASTQQLHLRRVAQEVEEMLERDVGGVSLSVAREVAELTNAAKAEAKRCVQREGLVRECAVALANTIRDQWSWERSEKLQCRVFFSWRHKARLRYSLEALFARWQLNESREFLVHSFGVWCSLRMETIKQRRITRRAMLIYQQRCLRKIFTLYSSITGELARERTLLVRSQLQCVTRSCRAVLQAWAELPSQRSRAREQIARKYRSYLQGTLAWSIHAWRDAAREQARILLATSTHTLTILRGTIAWALELWRKNILAARILRKLLWHHRGQALFSSFDEWVRFSRTNRKLALVVWRISNACIYGAWTLWHQSTITTRLEAQRHTLQISRLHTFATKRDHRLTAHALSVWECAVVQLLRVRDRVKRFQARHNGRTLVSHFEGWICIHAQTSLLQKSARLHTIRRWWRQKQSHMEMWKVARRQKQCVRRLRSRVIRREARRCTQMWAWHTTNERFAQQSVHHLVARSRCRKLQRHMELWITNTTSKRTSEQAATQATRAYGHIYCTRQKGWALRSWRDTTHGILKFRKLVHSRRAAAAKAERFCERRATGQLLAVFSIWLAHTSIAAARIHCLSASSALLRGRCLHAIVGRCVEDWRGAVEDRRALEKRQRGEARRAQVIQLLFRDLRASQVCRCARNVVWNWGFYVARRRSREFPRLVL